MVNLYILSNLIKHLKYNIIYYYQNSKYFEQNFQK